MEHATRDWDDLEESIFGSRHTFVHLLSDVRVWIVVHKVLDFPCVSSTLSDCLIHNIHQFFSFFWPFEVNLSSLNAKCSSFIQVSNIWHGDCMFIPVVFAHSRLFLLLSLFFGHFFRSIIFLFSRLILLLHFNINLFCENFSHVLEDLLDLFVVGVLTLQMIMLSATAVDAHCEGFRKLVEIAKCIKKLISTRTCRILSSVLIIRNDLSFIIRRLGRWPKISISFSITHNCISAFIAHTHHLLVRNDDLGLLTGVQAGEVREALVVRDVIQHVQHCCCFLMLKSAIKRSLSLVIDG